MTPSWIPFSIAIRTEFNSRLGRVTLDRDG
jgi:hypothetical protein